LLKIHPVLHDFKLLTCALPPCKYGWRRAAPSAADALQRAAVLVEKMSR
jgi:hypothetical protein